ncbi:hypothetical protein SERLA73DRAFT_135669, partial [Serpula lacrymans var. lacrymans S7.3]
MPAVHAVYHRVCEHFTGNSECFTTIHSLAFEIASMFVSRRVSHWPWRTVVRHIN